MLRHLVITLATLMATSGGAIAGEIHDAARDGDLATITRLLDAPGVIEPRITVLYDNYVHTEGSQSGWGFACVIEGGEKTILFDTGARAEILLANAAKLDVDLSRVEVVVISHEHGDHLGGLAEVLRLAPAALVFLPPSISYEKFAPIETLTSRTFFRHDPTRIITGAVLSGELGEEIHEQSLLLNTPRGVVVVAGCAHPGIEMIAARSRQVIDRPIILVFGGFHMGHLDEGQIMATIKRLGELDVEAVAPTHCTGEQALTLFKQTFADHNVQTGVGCELVFEDKRSR